MFAGRPRTSTSIPARVIAAATRSLRCVTSTAVYALTFARSRCPWHRAARAPLRCGAHAPRTLRSRERSVVVVGERDPTLVRDRDDVLRAVAAGPVVPHDRLEDEDHPGCHHEVVVERGTEIGPDQRHLRTVGADA